MLASLSTGAASFVEGSRMKCSVFGQSAWRITLMHSLNVSSVRSTPLHPTMMSRGSIVLQGE